jgi:DNA-binding transcriptional ArsR family regulator
MQPSFESLIDCFSSEIRTSILSLLAEHGPMTMGALAEEMSIAASTLSVHVAVMRNVGIVECTRNGREILVDALVGGVELILLPLPRLIRVASSERTTGEDEPGNASQI